MTSGLRDKRVGRIRGFTLLEVMLVMALIAIVFVGVAPVMSASGREKRLRAAAEEISEMVRRQRTEAQASGERRVLDVRAAGFFERAEPRKEVLALPEDVAVRLRAPGERWEKPDGQEWEFSPIGLVSPWSVRLQQGDAWIEIDYDLLTGRVAEERYAF